MNVEITIRISSESKDVCEHEYITTESSERKLTCSTNDSEFSDIYSGGLIADVVELMDTKGIDGMMTLCRAIEALGEAYHSDGTARVWMGPLYDAATNCIAQQIRDQSAPVAPTPTTPQP